MRAIILAAGRGSRLEPYSNTSPKCLSELQGTPLVQHQLQTLNCCGVHDVYLVGGYLADQLQFLGVETIINERWQETNMVESLFCAESKFQDDIIISYGDIVYQPSVLKALLLSRHDISVVVDKDWQVYWEQRFEDPLDDAETLKIDDKGRIIEIGLKPDSLKEIEAQYTGLMRFRGEGIDNLKKAYESLGTSARPWMKDRTRQNAYMTDLLMEIILGGMEVYPITVERGWFEVDNIEDLQIANRMWRSEIVN